MNVIKTEIEGLLILVPKVFEDHRGFFMESYNKNVLADNSIEIDFVQDNQSESTRGVLRGLHFQNPPHAQTKLVRVLQGKIIDAVVDIRKSSPTYGKSFSIELSAENKRQLLVPKGFAHGFSVLSKTAEILYKCDEFYNKESEGGLMYNDPAYKIDWGLSESEVILSEKDQEYKPFSEFNTQFQ